MQTIPEQLSSAGRAQVQAQLELFGSLATAAVENTGKLALLQLNATREVMDRSSAAWFQLLSFGPHNFLDLASKAQTDLSGLFDAARAPFAAATSLTPFGAPPAQPRQEAASAGDQPQPDTQPQQSAAGPQASPPDEESGETPEDVLESLQAVPEPPAARTPIAEAAAHIAPEVHAGLSAASVHKADDIAIPRVKPLEAASPFPAPGNGGQRRKGAPRK
ncbi:MAG TPA: hypothetical protein VFT37_14775 [Telluria sp.]|nr:hypothetical protein [Telluria sp.]